MPKKPRKTRKKRPNSIKVTPAYLRELQLKDIMAILSDDELEILQSRKVPSFTAGTMNSEKCFPITCNKKRVKELLKKIEEKRKAGLWP